MQFNCGVQFTGKLFNLPVSTKINNCESIKSRQTESIFKVANGKVLFDFDLTDFAMHRISTRVLKMFLGDFCTYIGIPRLFDIAE